MIIKDLEYLEVVELENLSGGYSSWIDNYVNSLLSRVLPSSSGGGSYRTPSSERSNPAPSSFSRSLDTGNDIDVSINSNSPGVRSFVTPDGNGFVQIGGSSNGGGRSFASARSGDFAVSSFF